MSSDFLFNLEKMQDWLPSAILCGPTDVKIYGISTDSRNIKTNDLFIALRGPSFDGHNFLAMAKQAGAAAALVSEYQASEEELAQIIVPDTKIALGKLAGAWRKQFTLPIVAVLGSNGKTTVKEMLANIFAKAVGADNVLATKGNLNNDIGLPLTLLRLRSHYKLAVIELGVNQIGETENLIKIAKPTVVVINNAQRDHQEFMGSVDNVAFEHGRAICELANDSAVVFPGNTQFTEKWRSLAGSRTIIDFDVQDFIKNNQERSVVQVVSEQAILNIQIKYQSTLQNFSLELATLGKHNINNAAAACAASVALGITKEAICAGLSTFQPIKSRMQIISRKPITIVDDSYNANPDSVRAAIEVLAKLPAPQMLILGDMGEMGSFSSSMHEEIGLYAKELGIEHLYATGSATLITCAAFGAGAVHFLSIEDLGKQLKKSNWFSRLYSLNMKINFDGALGSALIKGSRFMRMELVLPFLESLIHFQLK